MPTSASKREIELQTVSPVRADESPPAVSTWRTPGKDSEMVVRFHRQDKQYADWLRGHEHDGYVLNVAGSGSRLHRANCDHLWQPIREGAL